ncbi:MAG: hypothetical protein A2X79_05335 [Desulfuromonadaceae bacterium GWB2_53_15]|nr:MAG: hypothetical protein A2X83_06715 [Desulfuromonadales bacterium GWD2_54_10]OHB32077.1 MAG: hypothetical protein A2X79_05335 [Desulfuromonadaceae bacterium GWB2_53_15]
MRKTILISFAAAMALAATASAEVSVNVNIGMPAPQVVVSGPPTVVFETPPVFLSPSRLGFYIGVDVPYDIVFAADNYYIYYGNSWYRSRHYNGPWAGVRREHLPAAIRKHRVEYIRESRDHEYRSYREQREHYRGRHFRPEKERKEEWKDERRREKQEWKEEKRERKQRRHDHD